MQQPTGGRSQEVILPPIQQNIDEQGHVVVQMEFPHHSLKRRQSGHDNLGSDPVASEYAEGRPIKKLFIKKPFIKKDTDRMILTSCAPIGDRYAIRSPKPRQRTNM